MGDLRAGDTLPRKITFKNEYDELYDPTTISVDIVDPDGAGLETPLTIDDLEKTATGTYKLTYNLPEDAKAGQWRILVTATYAVGELQNTEVFYFTVVD